MTRKLTSAEIEANRNSLHVQARLRRSDDYPKEVDAAAFYETLKGDGHKDRVILTEALLLLRKKMDKGYQMPVQETEVKLTADMRKVLKLIVEHVQMLSTLDLSAARQSPDWDEGRYQDTTNRLNKSVVNLFGASKTYEDDDE